MVRIKIKKFVLRAAARLRHLGGIHRAMESPDVILGKNRFDLEPPAQAPKAARRVVFVVDDEAMVAEVVSVVLAMEGFETRVFTSPVDAWEAFQSAAEKPSVLITDYLMSPFDGLELIARCREAHPELRSVLYSGNVEAEAIQRLRVKPDAFLSKPFLPRELIQTVGAVAAG